MSLHGGLHLVVDANVLGHTANSPVDPLTFKASEILCRILLALHKIVLDSNDGNAETIMDEYERQARRSQIARQWIIALQAKSSEKIVYRPRASVHLSVLTDPDDEKYIQIAINSPNKTIISEDSDLTSIANEQEVLSLGIAIWGFDMALGQL